MIWDKNISHRHTDILRTKKLSFIKKKKRKKMSDRWCGRTWFQIRQMDLSPGHKRPESTVNKSAGGADSVWTATQRRLSVTISFQLQEPFNVSVAKRENRKECFDLIRVMKSCQKKEEGSGFTLHQSPAVVGPCDPDQTWPAGSHDPRWWWWWNLLKK